MNIFEIPLYYISFNQSDDIENHYKEHGFKNVNHFPAVDGRKMSLKKLIDDQVISPRAFEDLRKGRKRHSALSSKGAIGCTLSHYELWKKCADSNWPYIIITEEDNRFSKKITSKNLKFIEETIKKPNGMFVSGYLHRKGNDIRFCGLEFYIATKEACKKMVKKTFPIDLQTDWYVSHLATIKDINIDGRRVSRQQSDGFNKSSIQDFLCISCIMPTNNWYYVGFIILIIALVWFAINSYRKWRGTLESHLSN